MFPAPVGSPNASRYPLSKGPQREPHGHLVPPAKLAIQITLYNFLSMSTNVQPRIMWSKFYTNLRSTITWRRNHLFQSTNTDLFSSTNIKTWFKAFWDIFWKCCMWPWIRSLWNILSKSPPPAGRHKLEVLRKYLCPTTKYMTLGPNI